jgi:hypothetical protein
MIHSDLVTRNAALDSTTFDAERRSVEVVFATNAPVRRMDLDGAFEERLDMTRASVDLSELIGGPVLNSHNRSDVNAVLGVVESAQVDGERGTATIRFSERAAAIMSDVRQGILRSVSVGYVINQRRVDKDAAKGERRNDAADPRKRNSSDRPDRRPPGRRHDRPQPFP